MRRPLDLTCFTLGPFEQNAYLLIGASGRKAALVDPGIESEVILDTLRDRGLTLEWIVNTHGHLDHTAGNRFFKEQTGAGLVIHPADSVYLETLDRQGRMFGMDVQNSPAPDAHFEDGVSFTFDGVEFDVLHTPGHTPGGVCLRSGEQLIVGDTLFNASIGRTDPPGGSYEALIASIREKLFALPEETVCYPGHGPETTIGEERRNNPFVSDRALGHSAPEPS